MSIAPTTEDLVAHGYAPGNYFGRCQRCIGEFTGDKRSLRCEVCATHLWNEEMAAPEPPAVMPINVGALVAHCRAFIEAQAITCAETIHQTDRVPEHAPEFIEGICKIVGYAPAR